MTKQLTLNTFDIPSLQRFAVGFDRVFDDLHRAAGLQQGNNYPPYNIVKLSETNYAIEVAVAGFTEEDLNIEFHNGELIVKGTNARDEDADVKYLHRGIANREFIRTFALAENVEVKGATVKNGILQVSLEHVIPEEQKPRKIPLTFSK